MSRYHPLLAILTLSFAAATPALHGQGTAADYERASKLSARTRNKVFKDRVSPH